MDIHLDVTTLIWLAGITVSVIGFEVSRMYMLTSAVKEIKFTLKEIDHKIDDLEKKVVEYELGHKVDHEAIKVALTDNRHEHDRMMDRIDRREK